MDQDRRRKAASRRSQGRAAFTGLGPLSFLSAGGGALLALAASVGHGSVPKPAPSRALPTTAQAFVRQHCLACHRGASAAGKLDLTTPFRPEDPAAFSRWVKVVDRVAAGEMPPKSARQPTPASRKSFLAAVSRPLYALEEARVRGEGRSVWRRMNRYEYENTLRDLLGAPWLQVREMLPEDGLQARFNKVGDALDVSHVQMSRYLAAADYALHEVLGPAVRPETTTQRFYAREQRSFGPRFDQAPERATFFLMGDAWDPAVGDRPRGPRPMGMGFQRRPPVTVGAADPVKREQEAVGMVAGSYEPLTPRFDQFRAPVAGRYTLRLRAHSFWAGPASPTRWWTPSMKEISRGRTREPVTLYSSLPQGVTSVLRKLGTLDFGAQSTVGELDVWLLKGESIMPDPARLFRSRPPNWHNPLATPEGQPGVAFHWLEVRGPSFDSWPTPGQRLLAGGLPLKAAAVEETPDPATGAGGPTRPQPPQTRPAPVEIVPDDPARDGERLVRGFMRRAIRRPVQEAEIEPFVKLFHSARATGASFTDALLTTYGGVLCSPAFVTLEERPGPLDDHALASRLSYFLWNTEPDGTLRALADRGALRDPKELARQADRMLADPKAQGFVEGFLDYWLDLRKTANTSPDEVLYPDYYLDDLLTESSVDETRAFFTELIRCDLPARKLVTSDFVMVNERLAELYGIAGVQGCAIRRVSIPKDSVRGGLLTQASVLKVTANGTTTSPVLRGAWITERILGQPVPPPPAAVPAVEPDIRGATTIREQLAKHRTQPACASCHARIDPPGFALESFDVFGGWRDRYRALGDGPKVPGFGKNGQPFVFHAAQPVDPSGVLPDGRSFKDVRELKQLLVKDERQLARNLVRQLVTYATGAPVGFGDRPKVEAILSRAQPTGYGVKSLIHSIIASDLFRSK
jgi:mono/diheme cytochrome c family protein